MKKINGLRNMKPISRGALIEALQGKYVAMVGLIHIPYGENDWDDNNLDKTVAARLLEKVQGEL